MSIRLKRKKRLDSSSSCGTTLGDSQPRNVVSGHEARGENIYNCRKHDEPVKNTQNQLNKLRIKRQGLVCPLVSIKKFF